MERSRRRWRRLVVGIVIVVVLIAGALAAAVAFGLLLHDTATPVSIPEVVQRFREGKRGTLDGVYLYSTRGGEAVDALGGAHHRYPAKTTITAVRVPCGVRLRWEALEERSTTWTLCATKLGIELQSWQVAHRFFGQSDRTSYDCSRSVLVPESSTPKEVNAFRCRSSRGREEVRAQVVGLEDVPVAGAMLTAVHVRTVGRVTGGDHGMEIVDWWLDQRTVLPVWIRLESRTSRPLFVGDVHYRENADLRLLSKTPLR
jgi:hypothetical protein